MVRWFPCRSRRREWLISLMAYSLLIAPFGCPAINSFDDGGSDGAAPQVGLFINPDVADPLIVAGRDAAGNAFFVFGTRKSDGALEEVQAIKIVTADGEEGSISFELGRPTHIEGPDGSYAHVTYENVSSTALTASVELYDASTGQKQSFPVEIDLTETLAQIASVVRSTTGEQLETDFDATKGAAASALDKSGGRALAITIFSPLFVLMVVPFVAAISLTTIILGQVFVFVFAALADTLIGVVRLAFAPLFLLTEIFSDALIHIEVRNLPDVFISIPGRPSAVLR